MDDLVSPSEAKAWLDITDTARDALITSLARAASSACTKALGGRELLRSKRTEILSGLGGSILPVNHFPVRSVESVTIDAYTGASALDASLVTFDDYSIILRGRTFPRGTRNVTVVYSAGLDEIPDDVKLAAQYVVKAFWDARKTDMNSANESWNAIGGSSFWPTGPGSIPPQAQFLLAPYSRTYVMA